MSIQFDPQRQLFVLQTPQTTYAMAVDGRGRLRQIYWGSAIGRTADLPVPTLADPARISTENDNANPLEYRTAEAFEYGEPALDATFSDHMRGVRLAYAGHDLRTVNKQEILTIRLQDIHYPLAVDLEYTLYEGLDLISRRSVVTNLGTAPICLDSIQSATFYLPRCREYRLTHQSGNWGREFQKEQLPLTQSKIVIENRRGTSSGPQAVPFFALDGDGAATETSGEVWYGVLHWSGNFKITAEKDKAGRTSITAGINDYQADWHLKPGESFAAPLVTAGYSAVGFGKMSEALYDLQLDFLMPRAKAYIPRPIIYNSWYPYEFDVDETKLLGLAERAAAIGAELLVIDDGWFRGRENDRAGLGDWFVCTKRFPRGLEIIADKAHSLGMQFGLWVEPEMVNPDSDLYRAHPDWVVHIPTRERTTQRNQLVLNFARDDVRDFAIDFLDRLIRDYKLDYLKWDMNRYMTEFGWPDAEPAEQGSLTIRYIKNLYQVWETLNSRFPHVLYENCAHGGARADFGMVPYADRINRSDNADPVDVMKLHEGFTTLFLPKTAGGAGNISPSPNGINGRVTPLEFRARIGMMGSMSVGINLLQSPPEELAALKVYLDEFKTLRADLQDSYVYRLASALEHPYAILQYVTRDRRATTVFAFGHGLNFRQELPRIRLRGLDPDALYQGPDGSRTAGATLMNLGIPIQLRGDYASQVRTYRRID